MLKISGELVSVLDNFTFENKNELLEKLRKAREEAVDLIPEKREILKQLIGISIQSVYKTSEKELLRYKEFQNKRS